MNQGRPEASAAGSLRLLALRARSPGRQCWVGKHAKSTSSPSHTISWQHPAHASVGAMPHKDFSGEPSPDTSLKPCGAAGFFKAAGSWPMRRNWPASSAPMPSVTRRGVPNRLASTGIVCALGLPNINAGPPAPGVRSQISVVSREGETGAGICFSTPNCCRLERKPRKSGYFMFFTFFYARI